MKESRYNYFVPYKDRVICFNAMTAKVFSVNKEEFIVIKDFLKKPSEDFQHFVFFEKYGFIVDNETDEFDQFLLKNRSAIFDNKFNLIINPTLQCNFNCWYCYEKNVQGHMSEDTMNRIKLLLTNLVKENKISGLKLSWFGGEPLLNFYNIIYPLSLFAKELMEKNNCSFSNSITTNGYLMDDKMITHFEAIKLFFFQVTLDGDKESHDKVRNQKGSPSFDKIISNIINLRALVPESFVRLRINYTNEIINKDYESILKQIPLSAREKMSVDFQRVWQTIKEINPKDGENDTLLKAIDSANDLGFLVPLDGFYSIGKCNQCYVDRYNFAHINFDGKVYKCTARDYSEKYVCGDLTNEGKINWRHQNTRADMHNKAHFDNDKCRDCKILPLCVGPCYQAYFDYKNQKTTNFCPQQFREIGVENFIINYYLKVKDNYLKNKKQMELV